MSLDEATCSLQRYWPGPAAAVGLIPVLSADRQPGKYIFKITWGSNVIWCIIWSHLLTSCTELLFWYYFLSCCRDSPHSSVCFRPQSGREFGLLVQVSGLEPEFCLWPCFLYFAFCCSFWSLASFWFAVFVPHIPLWVLQCAWKHSSVIFISTNISECCHPVLPSGAESFSQHPGSALCSSELWSPGPDDHSALWSFSAPPFLLTAGRKLDKDS